MGERGNQKINHRSIVTHLGEKRSQLIDQAVEVMYRVLGNSLNVFRQPYFAMAESTAIRLLDPWF